jgi:hypothetical protein
VRRGFYVLALAMPASACLLVTDLGALSDGAANDGGNTTPIDRDDAAVVDARDDALADAAAANDAPAGDAADAGEAAATCGFAGPTLGLLAYYPFEEGSGASVHDCGPHHVDGTLIAEDAGTWTKGVKGGALHVATPNGCVDLGAAPALAAATMTVSLWVNIAAVPGAGSTAYFIGQAANADLAGWRLGVRSSGVFGWESSANGSSYFVDSPAAVALNVWHHVAATFAPNDEVVLFIDGTSVTTVAAVPPIAPVAVSMRIGCRSDNGNYLNGAIDELRLYDRVLSAAEITTLATP